MLDHEKYMRMALKEAVKAYQQGEIPIGAVLVNNEDDQVVATGFNLREQTMDATAHAEMEAIRKGCQALL